VFFELFAFLFGLLFGSFLNVCIYRLPRGLSVVRPRSACPKCGSPVRSFDNIPIISWLVLRGRCRDCRAPISARYPIVETSSGLLFALSIWHFGATFEGLKYVVFGFLILGLVLTDADTKILPDALTLPGFALGMVFSVVVAVDGPKYVAWLGALPLDVSTRIASAINALLGAAVGAFFLWGVGELYKRIRGVEGMGFGDVKLMAMVGAFLGPKLTVLTLMLGSLAGSIAGVLAMLTVYIKRKRRYAERDDAGARAMQSARAVLSAYQMPFGVFLGGAALFSAYLGQRLVSWYLSFFP
jgi:leader peptidase (prepilin peptidase)/N-methyltransferase